MTPLVLAGIGWLAWFLPGDLVVEEWAARQTFPAPLKIEATLEGDGLDAPRRVGWTIHSGRGIEFDDGRGGRWRVQGDRVVEGPSFPPPEWIPRLEILTLQGRSAIERYLRRHAIDAGRNHLARCGEFDCFVLGGRGSPAQLWIEKDAFFVRALQLPGEPRIELGAPRSWPEARGSGFPERIEFFDSVGPAPIATLAVESVRARPRPGRRGGCAARPSRRCRRVSGSGSDGDGAGHARQVRRDQGHGDRHAPGQRAARMTRAVLTEVNAPFVESDLDDFRPDLKLNRDALLVVGVDPAPRVAGLNLRYLDPQTSSLGGLIDRALSGGSCSRGGS